MFYDTNDSRVPSTVLEYFVNTVRVLNAVIRSDEYLLLENANPGHCLMRVT